MNEVAELLTGWPQSEATGQALTSVFRIENEKTRQSVVDPVALVLATGAPVGVHNHITLIARDGTQRTLDDSAAPIRDAAGDIVGAVLMFRDVGDRRRAERAIEDARAFAEGIVDTIREPLVVLDAEMRVRTANRSFYETFGPIPRKPSINRCSISGTASGIFLGSGSCSKRLCRATAASTASRSITPLKASAGA